MRQRLPQGAEPGARHCRDQEDGDGAPALNAATPPDWRGGFSSEPDGEGWYVRPAIETGGFVDLFGEMRVRAEGPGRARLRVASHAGLSNISSNVHGGFLLALVDQAMFVGPEISGVAILGGVTVDVTSQFLAAVTIGPALDVLTEVLRETGRMLFVRGQIEQGGEAKLAFTGTLRKPDRR